MFVMLTSRTNAHGFGEGYFKTWTVDHGLDLDYGPNSAGPPHAYISFSPCARTVLYVDLTAKLALPCQLVHRPFDSRVHFWA